MKLREHFKFSVITLIAALVIFISAGAAFGQTTLFTFHGHLTDDGRPDGNYDLQLALWDSANGGTQIGTTQTINAVPVSNGEFTVTVDFGAGGFNGADRFVETSARLSGSGGPFSVQTPRAQITSAPYAIRSLSAASADNVTVTGVPSGSGNYIQNSTSQQPNSSFNISGNGTAAGTLSANVVNANTQAGIGTTTPRSALEVKRNWDGSFGAITVTGDRPTIRFSGGAPANNDQWIIHLGSSAGPAPAGSLSFFFGGTAGTSWGAPAFSVTPSRTVQIPNLAAGGGGTQLCRNASTEITTCNSSSLRYKTNIATFLGGLDVINRLRPISFTWKRDSTSDVGFGAEEVEQVAPLFTFRNDQGEIEGVRYDRLSVLFVNAFKEQQQQIEEQRKEITLRQQEARRQQGLIEQQQTVLAEQRREVSALRKLVCRSHRQAAVCK